MGIINASLGRYVANHPELRPAPRIITDDRAATLAELETRIQSLDDELRSTPAESWHSGATVDRLYRIARLTMTRRAILAN